MPIDSSGTSQLEQYLARTPNSPTQVFSSTANMSEKQGLNNLYQMLMSQGRVDPRLLASAQASNSRSTTQQQDQARGRFSASGLGNSGLSAAIQAAIGSSGANRSANLNYQDISDSYGRNQQNLGLMNMLIQQPQLGYSNLRQNQFQFNRQIDQQREAARAALFGQIIGAVGTAAGAQGGCWVAESIFGVDAIETEMARYYVNVLASDSLREAYMEDGRELAAEVRSNDEMKNALRPIFLSFGNAAAIALNLE